MLQSVTQDFRILKGAAVKLSSERSTTGAGLIEDVAKEAGRD